MARTSSKVYAQPDFGGFSLVPTSFDKVEFSAKNPAGDSVKLTANVKSIKLETIADAAKFFGGNDAIVSELQESVNAWLMIQAKNQAKSDAFGSLEKLEKAVAERIAALESKHGRTLTDEEREKVRARVMAAFSDEI